MVVNRRGYYPGKGVNRRRFLSSAARAGAGAKLPAGLAEHGELSEQEQQSTPFDPDSVHTNIASALAVPRSEWSMPGRYPGVVAEVSHPKATGGCKPNHAHAGAAAALLAAGMKALTGAKDDRDAWAEFFTPEDVIGLKINPTGLKLLSNTHELTRAVIAALEAIGVPRRNIIIWDHFEHEMIDAEYTPENYPGVECYGYSYRVEENGKEVWKGAERMDEAVYYEFDIPGEYADDTMAGWMMNTGIKSYFPQILTRRIDKVVNMPVFKNTGEIITLCLKNMAYGVTSNCRRGHKIMHRFISEVCAFPAVRDKTVLNIADGLRACYLGGPVGVARYIWDANTIWVATDPVACDAVGWDFLFAKQAEAGVAKQEEFEERKKKHDFLTRAENLGLGTYLSKAIDLRKMTLDESVP
jgi:hypothetical protein